MTHRDVHRNATSPLARRGRRLLAACAAAMALAGSAAAGAQDCVGDCSGDGSVAINELVLGVSIALGAQPLSVCPAFAIGGSAVTVDRLVAAVGNALRGCPAGELRIAHPQEGMLVLAGTVAAHIALPAAGIDADSLTVALDGADVTDRFSPTEIGVGGTLLDVAAGSHTLSAEALAGGQPLQHAVTFTALALDDPERCEILNQADCLLPYPSSRFLVDDPTTPTGVRVSLPAGRLPLQSGTAIDPAPFAALDGFGPIGPILMHFPGGVDIAGSGAPRLLPETRTYDDRSLDADSPTVLLDLTSGERVLHFVELDARAAGQPERQALLLYPSEVLRSGHRYAVAVRGLRHADGSAVAAEPVFAALRDGRLCTISAIEQRRPRFEALFGELAAAGIAREDLILAFDFVVRSTENVSADALAMRDQSFAWLDGEIASGAPLFTVDQQIDHDCSAANAFIGREVTGTYRAPLFLTVDPTADYATPGTLVRDGNGVPQVVGETSTPFKIAIPCAALAGAPMPGCVIGHGLYSSADEWVGWLSSAANRGMPLPNAVLGGSDWIGYSAGDFGLTFFSLGDYSQALPALRDRLVQGQSSATVWARLLKLAVFNAHPAFQDAAGAGVLAGATSELMYWGSSGGGAETALPLLALSPDIDRALLDTPALVGAFLQRSRDYPFVQPVFGIADPLHEVLALALANDLITGAPATYAQHVTHDPLPGGSSKPVLFAYAQFDQAVPELSAELIARTLDIPTSPASLRRNRPAIADADGPVASAYVVYDTGSFSAADPSHAPYLLPLANLPPEGNGCDPHAPWPFNMPLLGATALGFLQPGGLVTNACNGACDGGEPAEITCGLPNRCDPAAGWTLLADAGCPTY